MVALIAICVMLGVFILLSLAIGLAPVVRWLKR